MSICAKSVKQRVIFFFLRRCLKLSLSEWKVHMTTGLQVPNEKPPQTAWVWAAGEREERGRQGRG